MFSRTSSDNKQHTQQIMWEVMFACIPGIITLWIFFGYGVLIQLFLACLTSLVAEGTILLLRRKPIILPLSDGSALLTAVLLALSLPALSAWWMIVLACTCAIIIAKQLYGGLGHNIFNPAMIGYVILLLSFPVQMNSFFPPQNIQLHSMCFIDSLAVIFTGATLDGVGREPLSSDHNTLNHATPPLNKFTTSLPINGPSELTYYWHYGLTSLGWTWTNFSFLLGGLYLIWRHIISWHIPVSFLFTLLICASLKYLLLPTGSVPSLLHIFSGAPMLGAFFIATDPVTSPITTRGQLIFGTLIGLFVWLIRICGGYHDGFAFSVLLANNFVPLIDYYTRRPRLYSFHY